MAMELDIPVIVLSQLNRKKDEDAEPSLINLRDSGGIEQDANIVLLLWDAGIEPVGNEQYVACKVAKNRSGHCGEVVFQFTGGVMTFEETDKTPYRGKRIKNKAPRPWEDPDDDFEEVPDQQIF